MPLPYTEFFDKGVEKGICSYEVWKEFARRPHKDFKPDYWIESFSSVKLEGMHRWAMRKFYFRPSYVLKRAVSIKTVHELKRNLKGVMTLIRGLYV